MPASAGKRRSSMHRRFLQILALTVCLGLLPAAALAKGGKGGGPPGDKGKSFSEHGSKDKDKGKAAEKDKGKGQSAGRGHRGSGSATAQGPSDRPSGWDQGKKTGWGDCDVPPGLAKKRGCDSHGFSIRERRVHSAQARGFRECAVAEDVARKRGCDSRGLSTRERSAERTRLAVRQTTTTTRRTTAATSTTTTSKTTKPVTRTRTETKAKPVLE